MALIPQLTLRNNVAPGFVKKGAPLTSDEIDSNFVRIRELVMTGGGGGSATGETTNVPNTLVLRNSQGNFAANIITASLSGNALTATTLLTSRSFSIVGDITAPQLTFNGSQNIALNAALSTTGVIAGTYTKVTTDNKGRITSGTNPTTLSGYGITDAYTRVEVDGLVQGLAIKDAVRAATTTNISLTGLQTIDTVSVIAGDRVLVKDQTNSAQNGIYVVSATAWTRSLDADSNDEFGGGVFTFVQEGTVNAATGWVSITPPPVDLGTTEIFFTQFSAGGDILAGDGLTKTGNTLSVTDTGVVAGTYGSGTNIPVFSVNSRGQLTSSSNTPITFPVKSIVVTGDGITATDDGDGDFTLANTGVTRIIQGTGVTISPMGGTGDVTINLDAGSFANAFSTITADTGSVVAEQLGDTLFILGMDGIATTGTPGTDTIAISPIYGIATALASTASAGTASSVARSDHKHPFPTAAQVGAISEPGTNGFIVRTGAGAITSRQLVAGTGITIANGDGVSANPTITNNGVTQIVAGTGITLSPTNGIGVVTINSSSSSTAFTNFAVAGQSTVVADQATDTLTLVAGAGISITTDSVTDSITITSTSVGGNGFGIIAVSGQPTVEADQANDTLTFVGGAGVTITTNAAADTVTFTSSVNSFTSIAVQGQPTVLADQANDSLTLVAGPGVAITTNDTTDTITIASSQNTFNTIAVTGQTDVVADSTSDTLTLTAGSGIVITTNAATDTITIASTASSNSFSTIAIAGQTDVIADQASDTLTLVAGNNISLLTNGATDSITINATVPNSFGTFVVSGQNNVVADQTNDSVTLVAGSGITITTDQTTDTITFAASGGSTTITDNTTTNSLFYPTFVNVTSGSASGFNVSSTKLTYNPSLGQLNAVVFNATSDRRAKTNIRGLGYGLDTVLQLTGKKFEMIDEGNTAIGFIADEVKPLVPELVGQNRDGLEGLNYGAMTAVLVEAIKDLKAELDAVRAELSALKAGN